MKVEPWVLGQPSSDGGRRWSKSAVQQKVHAEVSWGLPVDDLQERAELQVLTASLETLDSPMLSALEPSGTHRIVRRECDRPFGRVEVQPHHVSDIR